jgi:hypothetical protein
LDQNLGCRNGVLSGIDWFFEHNSAGIIIEDDIEFDGAFLFYCDTNQELLEKYLLSGFSICNTSSNCLPLHGTVWGWACHRKHWHSFRVFQPKWNTNIKILRTATCIKEQINLLNQISHNTSTNIDTWDFDWSFFRRAQNILTVMPKFSLTTNIGFEAGVHTRSKKPNWMPTLRNCKDENLKVTLVSKELDQKREFDCFSRKGFQLKSLLVDLLKINILNIKRKFINNGEET